MNTKHARNDVQEDLCEHSLKQRVFEPNQTEDKHYDSQRFIPQELWYQIISFIESSKEKVRLSGNELSCIKYAVESLCMLDELRPLMQVNKLVRQTTLQYIIDHDGENHFWFCTWCAYHGQHLILIEVLEYINPCMCAIEFASENQHLNIVQLLLNDERVDPSSHNNQAIRSASKNGHHEVVQLLLTDSRVDPSADDNYAIQIASENGHLNIVQLLLNDEPVDPSSYDNYAISYASENGHHEVVQLLLTDSHVDPSADNNYAIKKASENGHLKVLQLLMCDSRVDPSANDNYAIQIASENGHLNIVQLLLNDERVDPSSHNNQAIDPQVKMVIRMLLSY